MDAMLVQLAQGNWPMVAAAVGLAVVGCVACRGSSRGVDPTAVRLSAAERARLRARLVRVFFEQDK